MSEQADPPPTTAPIRIVIADDQAVVRAGVARILDAEDDMSVVAECTDGDEVPAAVAEHAPDLVLMDLRMKRVDGAAATRALRSRAGAPPVLVLTTFDHDDALWGALDAGAAGFVLKDASATDIHAAVRAVTAGGVWLDPEVAPRVLTTLRDSARPRRAEAARLDQLTARENDVLARIARGSTNREIAADLHLSEATVKTHVGAIFAKLGARDRAAAIVLAYEHGVVGLDPQ